MPIIRMRFIAFFLILGAHMSGIVSFEGTVVSLLFLICWSLLALEIKK